VAGDSSGNDDPFPMGPDGDEGDFEEDDASDGPLVNAAAAIFDHRLPLPLFSDRVADKVNFKPPNEAEIPRKRPVSVPKLSFKGGGKEGFMKVDRAVTARSPGKRAR